MALEIVIANRLSDGRTVYLAGHGWSERIAEAETAADEAAREALLARGKRAAAANEVVDPYLIAVAEEAGGRLPLRRRERIRSQGPTVAAGQEQREEEVA